MKYSPEKNNMQRHCMSSGSIKFTKKQQTRTFYKFNNVLKYESVSDTFPIKAPDMMKVSTAWAMKRHPNQRRSHGGPGGASAPSFRLVFPGSKLGLSVKCCGE